jgi:hypothetical protein
MMWWDCCGKQTGKRRGEKVGGFMINAHLPYNFAERLAEKPNLFAFLSVSKI